ncbi:Succinate--CoA ligase (ADP-forming) [Phytophthora cinnamomi]|uniref:Succinate--CoA ligase (ADP-forming) n=1 Tax=Phytophthora cinnamomi TaxID=4785 RepID=UPI00355A60FD|nr:Succinate--CoA ligase (ADP-forming) [Phytophthora cinnamomi]
MPLLLRPTAPSPSIDELAFAVPLSAQSSQRSVSSATSELQRCATHGRLSLRRRRSTAGTETDFLGCANESCSDPEHRHHLRGSLAGRASQQSLRRSSAILKPKDDADADFRDSKRSSRETQPDDDHLSSDGSYASEAERVSSVLSCGCSCADANEFAITSSAVVIEDRQLAVVDKELRDFRKTLVRKLYTRLTKISGLGRRKARAAKPVC